MCNFASLLIAAYTAINRAVEAHQLQAHAFPLLATYVANLCQLACYNETLFHSSVL